MLDQDEWQCDREVRSAALRDAPEAFVARFGDAASCGDGFWRDCIASAHRIVAEREEGPVGLISLGLHDDDPEAGEVFGLWTAPTVRGQGIARGLVSTAAQKVRGRVQAALLLGSLRQRICGRLCVWLRLSS